ncbi:MAG: hypothetical protein AAFY43_04090 [Pseudomonadota bacterium]
MTASQYYSFLTGGIGLLCIFALAITWLLWRDADARKEAKQSALEGVASEFRIALQRMVAELSDVAHGVNLSANALLPIVHPQLDGVNAALIKTDRNALAVIGATYQELASRKLELRAALGQGQDHSQALANAIQAAIDGITTLYMWEEHDGARPNQARTTRSWDVRDWMKGHGFPAAAFPGMHLRDEVVERLRSYGMMLTPKPLTHTASEYWAMQYDRKADTNAPFWKRSQPVEQEVVETAEAVQAIDDVEGPQDLTAGTQKPEGRSFFSLGRKQAAPPPAGDPAD